MTLLAKALNPLPEKYHGLQDKEIRYRKRHLDLIMNKDVRDLFIQRSRILTFIRSFLNDRGLWRLSRPYYIVLPEEPPLVLIHTSQCPGYEAIPSHCARTSFEKTDRRWF